MSALVSPVLTASWADKSHRYYTRNNSEERPVGDAVCRAGANHACYSDYSSLTRTVSPLVDGNKIVII